MQQLTDDPPCLSDNCVQFIQITFACITTPADQPITPNTGYDRIIKHEKYIRVNIKGIELTQTIQSNVKLDNNIVDINMPI